MMILLPGLPTLGRLAPRQRFELGERRPVDWLDVAARKLDAGHRRVAASKGQQRRPNARHVRRLGAIACFDRGRQWSEDAVREQNAEERSDERGRDFLADG